MKSKVDMSVRSVAGAGISDMANQSSWIFFLRYMTAKYLFNQNISEWLGLEDASLEGFSRRWASVRDKTGILMWSKIFLTEFFTGKNVVVVCSVTR